MFVIIINLVMINVHIVLWFITIYLLMVCQTPKYLHKQDIVVPCGNCAFCGATKRSDWATRLHYESKMHLAKKFITLTYADSNLHLKDGVAQLCKRDLQLWFKRVRRSGYRLRYYAVGEYGSKTHRPHYHVLLFGEVPDEVIREHWSLGHVHIGQVTEASVMYCLGYMVNKHSVDYDFKKDMPDGSCMWIKRERCFAVMSRGSGKEGDRFRYGLGSNYLSPSMMTWHKSDYKSYAIVEGQKRHLPRYYRDKIFNKRQIRKINARNEKEQFKRDVKWIRSPAMMKLRDPLAYRDEQIKRLAQKIRAKSKENLLI